jgi:hypothetical protein
MAITYKVLAQSAPSATTNTDVYTVGSGKQATVSTITVCNRSTTIATYRIAIRVAGSALSNEEYIAYDAPVGSNDSVTWTIGVTLVQQMLLLFMRLQQTCLLISSERRLRNGY